MSLLMAGACTPVRPPEKPGNACLIVLQKHIKRVCMSQLEGSVLTLVGHAIEPTVMLDTFSKRVQCEYPSELPTSNKTGY